MENIKKMFMCSCGLEGITVEKDLEDKEVSLQCYAGSGLYTKQRPIKEFLNRFKIAWIVLRKGEYLFCDIVFNKETTNAFADELRME